MEHCFQVLRSSGAGDESAIEFEDEDEEEMMEMEESDSEDKNEQEVKDSLEGKG